jgi:hypothetical protein
MNKKKFQCPCCGYFTLDEKPPGTFEICPVCYWEDDDVQFNNPNYVGGANGISLNQARKNYRSLGAIEIAYLKYVRKPLDSERC